MTEKILGETSEEKAFYVFKGPKLKSLSQLASELEAMSDESFKHHTAGRNDFSNWIKNVFRDAGLAAEIEGAPKAKMAHIIRRRLKEAEAAKEIDRHSSKDLLLKGIVDFAAGIVIGVILGIILKSLF